MHQQQGKGHDFRHTEEHLTSDLHVETGSEEVSCSHFQSKYSNLLFNGKEKQPWLEDGGSCFGA